MGEAVFSLGVRYADSHGRSSGFGEELSMLRVGDSKDDATVVSLLFQAIKNPAFVKKSLDFGDDSFDMLGLSVAPDAMNEGIALDGAEIVAVDKDIDFCFRITLF